MWKSFKILTAHQGAKALFSLIFLMFLLILTALPLRARPKDNLTTPGLVREFSSPPDEVRQAVLAVVHDQIIHGTLIFDKTPVLTGAEAVDSTPLFEPW